MTGHPGGAGWFCRRHFRAARELRHLPLPEALGALRARHRRGIAAVGGLLLLALLGGSTAWNASGPVVLAEVDEGYAARLQEGRLRGRAAGGAGAVLAAS